MTFVPAPGYLPAYNPPLPYVAPVLGGLWPGMAIYVQGVVAPQPDWLRVNLAVGPEDEADVALHLNPRFSGGVTVLNSRRGGRWGDERRRELHPLCAGTPFEMVISVTPEAFRILVNGTFYEEFPHRLPPEQVTAVSVDGDLQLHSASVLGGATTCPPCVPDMPQAIPSYPNCNLPVMEQPPTFHPTVPFITTIPGGLVPKKTIVIKGFIPHEASRFHINLRAGPGGDVMLHMNPRMDEGDVVVRNSQLGGSWGHEERELSGPSPFQRGRYFDLSIRCGNHRFKVFAEGQPLFDFQHRAPAGPHVDVLEIEGDVVLSFVHF
ncbi:PREDICTED: galectin-4 [Pseudopodoces humilis]|uniref:galectin-4 n=1 Tax=Pseudopodoces humilis TaxID=181119 RepID=UPI0006B7136C|nr:PREDICTED: galectin-4 [Pseudopodoces humilis]